MRDFFLRSLSSQRIPTDNLIARIRDNFRDALRPARWKVSSANGAPLHLLSVRGGPRVRRAQGVSFLTHAGVIGVLAFLAFHPNPPRTHPAEGTTSVFPPLKFPIDLFARNANAHPDPGTGSGGDHTLLPARAGNLAPLSQIQLVKPSIPPEQERQLPVPPSILDPAAAPVLTAVDKLGLPWMSADTNSPGRGKSHTIGDGDGDTMGDGTKNGPGGWGDSGRPYKTGTMLPTCLYCPNPGYTDEARESKLQGMVTLVVLVSPEGRATDIRIAKGLGLGLDERARDAVRGWRFTPAHDPGHHAVAAWITIEIIFRLF